MNYEQSKRTDCAKCKELTYKFADEKVVTCLGCGYKQPRTEPLRKRQSKATTNPDIIGDTKGLYNQPCTPSVREQFDSVMGRFHKLSKAEKEVIELLWEGKSQLEVAEILGITQQAVSVYLKRARTKLR